MLTTRPYLEMLTQELVEKIIGEAYQVLEEIGMLVDNKVALELLADNGARVDFERQIARFPAQMIDKARATVPPAFQLYDREGNLAIDMQGKNVHFAPGSAAILILDEATGQVREPVTSDLVRFSKVVEKLPYMNAQSTALIAKDVPEVVADSYRSFVVWQYCAKPLVTGTFSVAGFDVIKDILVAIAGSEANLRAKPRAIFDCCPSSPLKWSDVTSHNLMDCARFGIPAELVSMPLSGAVAPVTLSGSLVQHTAENLSGVVIHQLAGPGSPLVYGGSPAIFDMRKGTTPMGAIESMMVDASYNQIGKYLEMPTHAYMGLSDAKTVDAQAGFETGMGIVLAALSGVNMISGPGMLDFESCQSLEKLVIDHEMCGMANRLVAGIVPRDESMALPLLKDIHTKEHLLTSPHTLKWMQKEQFLPSEIVDRATRRQDYQVTSTIRERALKQIRKLEGMGGSPIDENRKKELYRIMEEQARKHNFALPEIR